MTSHNSSTEIDFQLMFKPISGRCNLDCIYCYYKNKHKELYPYAKDIIINEQILTKVFGQYLTLKQKQAEFCWQGGEPLLAGKDFFNTVVKLQQQLGHQGQIIGNALQTNGILIDEYWCEFFNEYRFLIGLSIDGPRQYHDFYRKFSNGEGSFTKAYNALTLMKKYNVSFNVLVTLNSQNVLHGANIYRFLVNSGVQYLQFIPILEREPNGKFASFSCQPKAYGKFMLDVFNIWIKRDKFRVSVRLFDSILSQILYNKASLCWNMPECPRAFIVEWNGDFYVCDHFVKRRWHMGNIMEKELSELLTSETFIRFSQLKKNLYEKCRDCEYIRFCNAGCPKHITDDNKNYFCASYKLFFKETLSEFKRIANEIRNSYL